MLFGETLLWEDTALGKILMFFLLAANNKHFFLTIFGWVVSFGSTPTKRRTQFSGNKQEQVDWEVAEVEIKALEDMLT